jgi:uncharacterized OsmC-like protein
MSSRDDAATGGAVTPEAAPRDAGPKEADSLRSVWVRRTAKGRLLATNARGAELPFGAGPGEFSPVELLLAAIAGCSALDVDAVTSRRAEPEAFGVKATAHKFRDQTGNHLRDIEVVFRVTFPVGADGDAVREMLPELVAKSHDRLCTVSRTVQRETSVVNRIEPEPAG